MDGVLGVLIIRRRGTSLDHYQRFASETEECGRPLHHQSGEHEQDFVDPIGIFVKAWAQGLLGSMEAVETAAHRVDDKS